MILFIQTDFESQIFYINLQRKKLSTLRQRMKRRFLTATLSALLIISSIDIFAQQTYNLPTYEQSTNTSSGTIEVYLPKADKANGCAVVLCPGGGMRALAWDSDVKQMATFLNERGIAAIGLRYHLNKAPMPQGMKMPPMVDVTHPDAFPKADAKCAEAWNKEMRDGRSNWTADQVKRYRTDNKLSWHERSDMKHCDLVSRDIHGKIRHSGGVYECGIRDGVDVRSKFDV